MAAMTSAICACQSVTNRRWRVPRPVRREKRVVLALIQARGEMKPPSRSHEYVPMR